MPKVGTIAPNNYLYQFPRTLAKARENTNLFNEQRRKPDGIAPEYMDELVYSILLWTANDVLEQCMADGYVPTQEGVI